MTGAVTCCRQTVPLLISFVRRVGSSASDRFTRLLGEEARAFTPGRNRVGAPIVGEHLGGTVRRTVEPGADGLCGIAPPRTHGPRRA